MTRAFKTLRGCLLVPRKGAGEIEAQRGSVIHHSILELRERQRHKEAEILSGAWREQRAASSSPGSKKAPDVATHGVRRYV